jgi:hypothetical protein
VVRIPSLTRRTGTVPTRDENNDGRIDGRDASLADQRLAEENRMDASDADDRAAAGRVYGARSDDERDMDAERAADRAAADRAAAERAEARFDADRAAGTVTTPHRGAVDTDGDGAPDTVVERDREVPVGPRPRTSLMATLSLIFGVAGAFFVLSGTLAGYGIALGAIGVVLGFVGMAATRRRHVAGKLDALLGFGIGAAAVVLGILALTGDFGWPTMADDWDARLRAWLDAQFVNRF